MHYLKQNKSVLTLFSILLLLTGCQKQENVYWVYPDYVPIIEAITNDQLKPEKAQFELNRIMSYFEYADVLTRSNIEGGIVELLQTDTCVIPFNETVEMLEWSNQEDQLIEVSSGCFKLNKAIDLKDVKKFYGFYLMQNMLEKSALKTAVITTEGMMYAYGMEYQTQFTFKGVTKKLKLNKNEFAIKYETESFSLLWVESNIQEGYHNYLNIKNQEKDAIINYLKDKHYFIID